MENLIAANRRRRKPTGVPVTRYRVTLGPVHLCLPIDGLTGRLDRRDQARSPMTAMRGRPSVVLRSMRTPRKPAARRRFTKVSA